VAFCRPLVQPPHVGAMKGAVPHAFFASPRVANL
jgi:hypothetical protein